MNVEQIYDGLLSHAASLGLFQQVSGYEPKAAPLGGLHGALWLAEVGPATQRSGLTSTSVRLVWNFRIGQDMMKEPQDETDRVILVATAALMAAYSGDFTLDGELMEIDLLGSTGYPLSGKAGYLQQDQKMYRVMVISIPMIVNDVFTQNP